MSHIFISHSTKDGGDAANQLVAALEATGRRCWIAPRDVKAGTAFPGQIVSAIRASRGLVLLLTPAANQSHDVLQELHHAHNAGKPIVPLIVSGTQPSDDLDYFLAVRQQIPWTEAQTVAKALAGVFVLADDDTEPPEDLDEIGSTKQARSHLQRTVVQRSTTSGRSTSAQVVGHGNTVIIQQHEQSGGTIVAVNVPDRRPVQIVDRVHVKAGDTIQPGSRLVTFGAPSIDFPSGVPAPEIAELLAGAAVAWSMPSPVGGVIESVHLSDGQLASKGDLIAVVRVREPK